MLFFRSVYNVSFKAFLCLFSLDRPQLCFHGSLNAPRPRDRTVLIAGGSETGASSETVIARGRNIRDQVQIDVAAIHERRTGFMFLYVSRKKIKYKTQ